MKKYLCFAILTLGCQPELGHYKCAHNDTNSNDLISNSIVSKLAIDNSMSNDQLLLTMKGIFEWSTATSNLFNPDVTIKQVNVGDPNSILLLDPEHEIIVNLQNNMNQGKTIVGYQTENYILMVDYEYEEFAWIVSHEIGHFLGLGHSDNPNDIMYFAPATGCISQENIDKLCTNYSCENFEMKPTCNIEG